jgi:hypothetical protein
MQDDLTWVLYCNRCWIDPIQASKSAVAMADWGKKELVWTVTIHGKTERAVGWLQPEWERSPLSR